jgi:hypothetical protein
LARATFGKREREQTKKAKAEAKRQRRQKSIESNPGEQPCDPPVPIPGRDSANELLSMIADLHQRYEAGQLSFEEFETTKADLLARLVVE